MRHRVSRRTLNRNTKQRAGLLKSLARELVEHGSIVTTEPKAKELKRLADKLMTTAKKDSLHARRSLHRFFGKRDSVNTLVEQVMPVMKDRTSGFTRIVRQGVRSGDNTQLAQIAWVVMPEKIGSLRNPSPTPVVKKPARKASAQAKTAKPAPAKKKTAQTAATKATKKATPAKKPVAKKATKQTSKK